MVEEAFINFIQSFSKFENKETIVKKLSVKDLSVNKYINEFWTSKQRQGSSIHEVSYRACFKPQLPNFFINKLTQKGDTVYDPFSGRGTTVIEAARLGRNLISNDINPLSEILTKPRLIVPKLNDVRKRLLQIPKDTVTESNMDLSMFYHKQTLSELLSLREYFKNKLENGTFDHVDSWIRMVATSRLTGHSSGFFSVYTLPPNQAVSQASQIKINKKMNQKPPYRDIHKIILNKSKSLTRNLSPSEKENLSAAAENALFLSNDVSQTKEINEDSVQLLVTSPPFLDVVQYSKDNWLRCWFNLIDDKEISKKITTSKTVESWSKFMQNAFDEFYRIIKPNGWVAFEVGEVRNGSVRLDEVIAPIGVNSGFECKGVLINSQDFTKTSHIWGIGNNKKGTNTNRIVLLKKPQ